MDLVVAMHDVVRSFPRAESFRLSDQLLRAIVSVPANIAEGHSRHGPKAFAGFLTIAKGSLMEAETYVLIAKRIGYADGPKIEEILVEISEISRMLSALRVKILARARRAADSSPPQS
jgi:four helix bundle protein